MEVDLPQTEKNLRRTKQFNQSRICHKTFTSKSSLKRHINHHCKLKDKIDIREENHHLRQKLNMPVSELYDVNFIDNIPNSNIPTCNYCFKTFSRQKNVARHQTLHCTVIRQIIEENHCLKKKIQEGQPPQQPQHISNISNINSHNTNNITNNNNNNNTFNIVVNAYGDENMHHLGPVIMKLIKDHAESAVTDLICERYYDPLHPENKTVMLKPKEKWPGRKYNGERWEVDDKMSLITDVLKKNFSLLDQVFSVIKHTMHPFCDWTEVRKKWEIKDEPSKETKDKTEKILINQSLSESNFRGNVIEDE